MTTPYEELGIEPEATADEVKRAYRRRAQKAHPDRGGSEEEFHQVQKAYDILSDPKKRALYDAGGDAESTRYDRALANVMSMFSSFVANGNSNTNTDFIDAMRLRISSETNRTTQAIEAVHKAIGKRKAVLKRLSHKGAGPNILANVLRAENERDARNILAMEEELEVHAEMRKVLDEYSYEVEPTITWGPTIYQATLSKGV